MIPPYIENDYLEEARDRSLYKGSKKKTTEMFKEELAGTGSKVIIVGEYIKAKEKIACLCPDCDYEWKTTPNRLLSQKTGCPRCGGRVLPTTSELNSKLSQQNKTFCVSDDQQVTGSQDKLRVVCNICEYSWKVTYLSMLRVGYSCKVCAKYNKENPSPEKQEELNKEFQDKLRALNKNFTLVGNYNRVHRPVTVMCNSCKKVWANKAGVVLAHGCSRCSGKERGSLDKVQKSLETTGIEVSGEYKSAYSKLNCFCTSCNEEWQSSAHNLNYHGCPFCCFKGRIPKNRPASLYYVRIENHKGIYWKIGITTKSNVLCRFKKGNQGSKITLLYSFLFEDGEQAYFAEKNILRLYKPYLNSGMQVLADGNTEIFVKDVLQMDHLGGKNDSAV